MRWGLGLCVGVLLVVLTGHCRADEDFQLIGVGETISTSPYIGVGKALMTVPIIVWDYKGFYVRGSEAGYHFLQRGPLELSVLAEPRFMGYHTSDSSALDGMKDRDISLDAGLRADIDLPWEGLSLGVKVSNDVLNRNRGHEAELSLSSEIAGKIWRFSPSAGLRVQSSQMVSYYYGVKTGEARADRQAYDPGMALNYFADTVFSIGISKNWVVITRAGVDFLSSEITESPIVARNYLLSGMIGLARRF